MSFILRIMKCIISALELVLAITFAGMFIFLCLLVVLRYFFNTTIYGGNEVLEYLFIYLTSFGAAILLFRREHICVDLFPKIHPKLKCIQILVENIFILILNVALLILSIRWIHQVGDFLTPILHIKQLWVQISIPIGCALASVCTIYHILNQVLILKEGSVR